MTFLIKITVTLPSTTRRPNNYRELTQCDGVLRGTGSEIEVHLVPQVNYPPKLRRIVERHLEDRNARSLTLPAPPKPTAD